MGMRFFIIVCVMVVTFCVSVKMISADLCRQGEHRVICHEVSFILALLTALTAGMHLEYYYFKELNSVRYTCEIFVIMGVYVGLSLLITLRKKKERMFFKKILSMIPIMRSNKVTRNSGQYMKATGTSVEEKKLHNVKRKWSTKRGH